MLLAFAHETIGDVTDERIFRKPNDSDCTQWALMCPGIPSHVWAIIWILFEVGVLIGFVLIGIVAFKYTPDELQARAGMHPLYPMVSPSDLLTFDRYIPSDIIYSRPAPMTHRIRYSLSL